MNIVFKLIIVFLFLCSFANAQDTIKVKRPDDYYPCKLVVCVGADCYTDSMPKKVFFKSNVELRISNTCKAKLKNDIFISSFEVWNNKKESPQFAIASSSFMNVAQKKIIQKISIGDSFIIKNVSLHAPDGFNKKDNIEIKLY